MREGLLEQPLIHYDETTYQVLKEEGRATQSKSYMWVGLAGGQGKRVILFDYAPTRAGTVPISLLDDFSGPTIMRDTTQSARQTVLHALLAGYRRVENLPTH